MESNVTQFVNEIKFCIAIGPSYRKCLYVAVNEYGFEIT